MKKQLHIFIILMIMSCFAYAKMNKVCIKNNFGIKICGYSCVRTPFKVVCTQNRDKNCVKDVFNDVRCGYNCRINQVHRIECDSKKQ